MSLRSWLYRDRTDTVTPLIDVDERGTGPSPCCAHREQRLREADEARAAYFGQACDLAEKLAEAEACIAELTAALDRDRPAPDREALAEDLRRAYWAAVAPRPGLQGSTTTAGGIDESGWAAAADTAIDTCRGLREAGGRPAEDSLAEWEMNLRAPTPGDPDRYSVHRENWCHARDRDGDWICTRVVAHDGWHVAGDQDQVLAVWPAAAPAIPGGESPGSGAASPDPAPGDLAERTALARVIADADTGEPASYIQSSDVRIATAVLAAGYRRTHDRPDQRPVIAAILAAHDVLEDGACRCGWLGERIYHAEHVAAQIVGTGAVAR